MPKLGAYDVRSIPVLEQHARWIREAGVGAVALSWWGRESWQDRTVPLILDVLRAHDLKATFALEPYADDRARYYASDILYLLREYGEKRHWDSFLLLRNADGRFGPVFKSFRTVLPETATDCLGEEHPVADFTAGLRVAAPDRLAPRDAARRLRPRHAARGLARVRAHAGLRASTASASTTTTSRPRAIAATPRAPPAPGLLFSFNVNPGYDQIEPRPDERPLLRAAPTSPRPPPASTSRPRSGASARPWPRPERIRASWEDNARRAARPGRSPTPRRGFLLVYLNSFNEWHEGHAFEPMKDAAELTADERALGYRNPERGDYRLRTLAELQRQILED